MTETLDERLEQIEEEKTRLVQHLEILDGIVPRTRDEQVRIEVKIAEVKRTYARI